MEETLLSVTVVSMDYQLLKVNKSEEFVKATDSAVPVVRVFGSTDAGQRVCVHIHGVIVVLLTNVTHCTTVLLSVRRCS